MAESALPRDAAPGASIEAMRARGAAHFDPAGFRFLEAMARRIESRGDAAAGLLAQRLAEAVAAFGERFDRARNQADRVLADATARFPDAADALQQCHAAGDFGGMQRLVARLAAREGNAPLTGLLDHIRAHTTVAPTGGAADVAEASAATRTELKSMRYFRSTWSKLSVERQMTEAYAQAPENAGPLNSHFLVLRALTQMRDTAPAYLEQFLSYVDALLWLDQVDSSRGPAQKTAARDKKRKPGRGGASTAA